MDVSLVVPLAGGPDQALRCLSAIAALPEDPPFEVVVVDDASVGLEDLLARLEGDVVVERLERRSGLAAALQRGLRRATGTTAVVLRDAAELGNDALRPLLAALEQPGVTGATAVTAGAEDVPPVGALVLAARRDALLGAPAAPDALAVAALVAHLGAVAPVPRSIVLAPGARAAGARGHLGEEPELTVVIPTLDATSERVRRCIASIHQATDVPHEIVVVDNGAPPQGFTAPVNAGLRAARGRYAVVCNDDVEVLPGWWAPLRAAIDAGAVVSFPTTVEGGMRTDFAAWCFAVSRDGLERFAVAPGEFFDPELVVWFQDTDLLDRLRAAGVPPVLVDGSRIRHGLSESVGSTDPALRAWIEARVARDRQTYESRRGRPQAAA